MSKEIECLERKEVNSALEYMRTMLAKQFGVTLTEDVNGAWGPMGTHRVTLRFTDPKQKDLGMICVTMAVEELSSSTVDQRAQYERDHPQ